MPNNNKPNRLNAEESPYLLQQAHNTVNWHPWEEEACSGQYRLFDLSLVACLLE
ncbi:DUF255 domain-containing protein [Pseudomonas sp. ISL-88]|uniref:DUF255 domain-containing protein n=1 Tax=Bacteria TaxID=2 RepID=UPI001BE8299A|nr:DUF255 domain-containing protein [Pseudomonas sp. ISL-88]